MHTNSKIIISFIFGAATGVAGTYFYLKDKNEKKLEEQIEAAEAYYKNQNAKKSREEDSEKQDEIKEEVKPWDSAKSSTDSLYKKDLQKKEQRDYSAIARGYAAAPEEPKKEEPKKDLLAPYIISESQYIHEHREYEKIELTYFLEDRTLCDEEDITMDPLNDLGEEALYMLDRRKDDMIFVRNPKYNIDYMVMTKESSYKAHLGLS